MRSGFAAGKSGPTFFLPAGKIKNPIYTDEYLERHGAAKFSTVIMTPSGYLTTEAWPILVPRLSKGIRFKVAEVCKRYGISGEKAAKLLVALTFDGFKVHTGNLAELILMADDNILAAVEDRDSSEINQVCKHNKLFQASIIIALPFNDHRIIIELS